MAKSTEQIQAMVKKATGVIPTNPEIAAKMAQEGALQPELPATPPGVPAPTELEQGLEPGAADFFGTLAADMDAEVSGTTPEPAVPTAAPLVAQAPVEELPYEPPVHLRQPGEIPESLEPQPVVPQQLEAAIEQPLVEEEIRLTAEQWAASQRALTPTPSEHVHEVPKQPEFDPAELEAKAIEALTNTEYALSEEETTLLISEPDKVLPGLAARMHVRMQVQLANQIAQILPGIIQSQIEGAAKVQSLESSFFSQYPELNKPAFRGTVQESLTMIRQVNPNASRDEVMRDGAALAAVRLRTKLGGAQEPAQMPALEPMPLQPPQAAPQQTAPFAPAQSGGASEPVVPTDPNQGNIWAELANDLDW